MAEIILPPEENEETPQAPELNIDKPTENSKVITIEFEAKKTNKVSTKDTNQQLYTTDTDAWFEFKETSLEGANGTYSVVFRNRHDGSIFQRTGDVVSGVAYYKIPQQEIRHAGAWRGQIVYTLSNGDTTAREFDYDVKGHILDGKDVREIVVEDFETLMSQLNSMKDNTELELADLVNTAERNELERQQFYESLVEDINDLQENYQELLDTGVLQTNINEKLEELEGEYAPKLTEVTAQLAQNIQDVENLSLSKANKIDLSNINNNLSEQISRKRDKGTKISSNELDTSSDKDKIKQINLSEEVKQMITGKTPVNAEPSTGGVNETHLADDSVTFYKRTALGNNLTVAYVKNLINFDTVEGKVTIPSDVMFRYGNYSKTFTDDFHLVTGGNGYYLFWDVKTGEILRVNHKAGVSAYKEDYVLICSVSYPSDFNQIKVEGLDNYTIDGKSKKIISEQVPELGRDAHLIMGYGQHVNIDSDTGIITIPGNTFVASGKYRKRFNQKTEIQAPEGYSAMYFDMENEEFLIITANASPLNFRETYLYVFSIQYNSKFPQFIDIEGISTYTIDNKLGKLSDFENDLDIKTIEYSIYHPLFTPRKLRFIGHRGLSYYEPENTIPAFVECAEKEIFGAETDIRRTKDGYFVCIHDATVDRTTDGKGAVSDLTLDEIKALSITHGANIEKYEGLKVPTLEEFLITCSQYGIVGMLDLYLDIEDIDGVIDIVDEFGMQNSVIYTTTSPARNQLIASKTNSLVFSQGGGSADLSDIQSPTHNNWGNYYSQNAYDNYPDAIKDMHNKGMIAGTWVVNNSAMARDLFEKGIDLIATDKLYSLND